MGWQGAQAQWTEQTSGLTGQLYSVSAVDDNIAWVCAAAGRVIRTTNGGTTWDNATGTGIPGTLALYHIWAFDANTALVTGSGATAFTYRTTNAGTTWTQVFSQTGGFINAMWFTSPTTGVMQGDPVGGRWSLWKTVNGGANWDSIGMYLPQAGAEAGWNNAIYGVGNSIWFGTNNSRVYYNATAGIGGWIAQTTPDINTYALWFNTPTQGLSGGASIMTTSNAGVNWTTVAGAPGTGNFGGITGVGTNYWSVRSSNLIYRSTNGGANWTTEYTAPTPGNTFAHITRARTGSRLWAVRSGGLISKSDGVVGITPVSGEVPSDYKLSQNYPNPFNPSTNIQFAVPVNGLVKLTVYDALGREISTLVNEVKAAGTYNVDFNASALNSGVYFYTIESGSFRDTKKMLLVK